MSSSRRKKTFKCIQIQLRSRIEHKLAMWKLYGCPDAKPIAKFIVPKLFFILLRCRMNCSIFIFHHWIHLHFWQWLLSHRHIFQAINIRSASFEFELKTLAWMWINPKTSAQTVHFSIFDRYEFFFTFFLVLATNQNCNQSQATTTTSTNHPNSYQC